MSRLAGKVAFITGAGRGMGRSHAVRLATEGADIIGVDICRDFDSMDYPAASTDDLAETVRQVEALGRRMVARIADVRDAAALRTAVQEGVKQFGRLDFAIANAGISTARARMTTPEEDEQAWNDVIAVNLTGAWNSVQAAIPYIVAGGRGGSIVFIGSTAGLSGLAVGAYTAAKHGIVGLMRGLANELAEENIRVNAVHPMAVNTMMAVHGQPQTRPAVPVDDGQPPSLLEVEMVEPEDVSAAVAFLLSDDARYITGTNLPVDAGFLNRVG
ncbi:MAG TPA: mycofactocin-coupled SDR family oxidoreductase [Jatrophihabitans sp.]|nr:mycofactocin-coupled SDR family oxidoreductase [Jatrophihabitans sp.]